MTTASRVSDSREAFEKWAESRGYVIARYKALPDMYTDSFLNAAWEGWKAALACQGPVVIDDAVVTRAARVLCHRQAVACGVNNDDQWYVYAAEFKAEALDVLTTALIAKANGHE